MNESDPSNNRIHDKIGFVTQNISDLSQLSLAVAIGLFGILAISVGIDQVISNEAHTSMLHLDQMGHWEKGSKIILSVAYFALVLLGSGCIIWHKFHSLLQEKLIVEHYRDYIDDLKEVAKVNWFLKWLAEKPVIDNMGKLKRGLFLMIFTMLIPYLAITASLWVFIVLV